MIMWHVQNVLKHKVTFSSQFCHYVMKSERHEDASCKEWVIKLIVVSHCHENVTKMWWSILSTCFLAPHIWKFPPCKKAMRSFTMIINNVPWVLSYYPWYASPRLRVHICRLPPYAAYHVCMSVCQSIGLSDICANSKCERKRLGLGRALSVVKQNNNCRARPRLPSPKPASG